MSKTGTLLTPDDHDCRTETTVLANLADAFVEISPFFLRRQSRQKVRRQFGP